MKKLICLLVFAAFICPLAMGGVGGSAGGSGSRVVWNRLEPSRLKVSDPWPILRGNFYTNIQSPIVEFSSGSVNTQLSILDVCFDGEMIRTIDPIDIYRFDWATKQNKVVGSHLAYSDLVERDYLIPIMKQPGIHSTMDFVQLFEKPYSISDCKLNP